MSRLDHLGNSCPSTLGEYRDLWAAIGGEGSKPVAFIDQKIAEQGRDMEVVAADSQMILLFGSLLGQDS